MPAIDLLCLQLIWMTSTTVDDISAEAPVARRTHDDKRAAMDHSIARLRYQCHGSIASARDYRGRVLAKCENGERENELQWSQSLVSDRGDTTGRA